MPEAASLLGGVSRTSIILCLRGAACQLRRDVLPLALGAHSLVWKLCPFRTSKAALRETRASALTPGPHP